TVDGGASWVRQLAQPAPNTGTYLSRSPAVSTTIYASFGNIIYQSVDDGVTWNRQGNSGAPAEPFGLLADPISASTLYTFSYASPNLYISTNAGATWRTVEVSTIVSLVATND